MSVTLDIFQPRVMLDAVMQMKPPERFVLNTFFSTVKTFDTLTVDIDIFKDKRRISPFSNPLDEGKVVDAIGYKTRNYKPGYCKPKMRTTAQDLLKRQPGQHLYAPVDPQARAAAKLGEDLAHLDDMIARREEWMALRALQDGEVTIDGDGDSRTIDFDFDAGHIEALTGTDAWDDAASDPIKDLLTWRRIVGRDSGIFPTDVIMGNDAAESFRNHAKVQALFDKFNIFPGEIRIAAQGNVISYGFIAILGMNVYTINEFFIDPDDDTEKEMVDAKNVILLSRNARMARYYGAIQVVEGLVGVPRFPMSWETKDPSARWVQLHSAPLPTIEQPDAVFTAQVLE